MKKLAILLTIALLLGTFAGCQPSQRQPALDAGTATTAPAQQTEETETSEPTETDPPQTKPRDPNKIYSSAQITEFYSDHEIIVIIDKSWYDKAYTAEDFSEFGCIDVKDISEEEDYKSMLQSQYRTLLLTLQEESKQNVLDCIKILELREDMYFVDVKRILPVGDSPDALLEAGIRKAYCDLINQDYKTLGHKLKVNYWGQYGDVYAVYVDGPFGYTAAMRNVTVYGYKFVFSSGQKMYIYRDGELCALDDVEANAFISKDIVARIYQDFGHNSDDSVS